MQKFFLLVLAWLPNLLYGQDCEIELVDSVFICGFEHTLNVSPANGIWSYECDMDDGLVWIDAHPDGTVDMKFSSCGLYEIVYSVEVPNICMNSDTIFLFVEDASSSMRNGIFNNDLAYDPYSCHTGASGQCTHEVSIQGFPPPMPSWSFCGEGTCSISQITTEVVEDPNGGCIAEMIDVQQVNVVSNYSNCWEVEQDSFIVIDAEADTVIHNDFLSYLDSLLFQEILANLESCESNAMSCFGITEDCIDSIRYDTTELLIPVHLGGNWNLLLNNDTIPLQDSTAFELQFRDYFLIIEPGADYYGPGNIDLRLFELVNGGSDTIPVFEDVSFQMLWTENWIYDSLEVIRPETVYVDSIGCQSCGGDSFASFFNVPSIPSYDCGPITISFEFECACSFFDISTSGTFINCEFPCAELSVDVWGDPNVIAEWISPSGINIQGQYVTVCEPGNYQVIVTDFNGCSQWGFFDVIEDVSDFDIDIPEPMPLSLEMPCVLLEPSIWTNANGDLVYDWSGPENFSSTDLTPEVCAAGTYFLTVTDPSNACSATASVVVEEEIIVFEEMTEEICEGECFFFNNVEYCEAGIYEIELSSTHFVELEIQVLGLNTMDVMVELCPGEGYILNGEMFDQSGTYEVIVPGDVGCDTIVSLDLQVEEALESLEHTQIEICGEQNIVLEVDLASNNGLSITWQDGTTGPQLSVNQAGNYVAEISNHCETITQSFEVVDVFFDDFQLYTPNVFSPNGDGINDEFICFSNSEYDQYDLYIFDRWGNQLYHTNDIQDGWNGTYNQQKVPVSNYVYLIEYQKEKCDQSSFKDIKTGIVTLLR